MEKLTSFWLPLDPAERTFALEQLVRELWLVVQDFQESFSVPQREVPSKPREGMIRYADGVGWNPGAGAGIYQYRSGTWNKF